MKPAAHPWAFQRQKKLERNGQFSLFDELIHNVEMGLAKAHLSIAHLYAGLVADESLREWVFGIVVEEFEEPNVWGCG
jgi:phosphoenolpyruvate carboxylase